MVEFPFAYVVKVDIRADGLNLFDIRRNKVYIINRTEEDIVKCRVVRGKFNCGYAGICFYIDLTDNRRSVALFIANLEFDGMNAVRENAVRNGHNAALDCAGNFNAVHIRFCGGFIKSCRIVSVKVGNSRGEGQNIVRGLCRNASCKFGGIAHSCISPTNGTEYGCVSVVGSCRIVYRYIVDINNYLLVYGFIICMVISVRRIVAVMYCQLKHIPASGNAVVVYICGFFGVYISALGNIDINIVPTGLIEKSGITAAEPRLPIVYFCFEHGTFRRRHVDRPHRTLGSRLPYADTVVKKRTFKRIRFIGEIYPHSKTGRTCQVYLSALAVL